nr:DNA adenine methylase [Rhodovulum sp. 12E13]
MHLVDRRPLAHFRPIQYLGNKTRLLSDIRSAMQNLASRGAPVADLFSGTSVVARALSIDHPVTAVDVQAYAEVLGRAMLTSGRAEIDCIDQEQLVSDAGRIGEELRSSFGAQLEDEENALRSLEHGDATPMAQIINRGSLAAAAQTGEQLSAAVRPYLEDNGKDATATIMFGGVYFSYEQAVLLDALAGAICHQPEGARPLLNRPLKKAASTRV